MKEELLRYIEKIGLFFDPLFTYEGDVFLATGVT